MLDKIMLILGAIGITALCCSLRNIFTSIQASNKNSRVNVAKTQRPKPTQVVPPTPRKRKSIQDYPTNEEIKYRGHIEAMWEEMKK